MDTLVEEPNQAVSPVVGVIIMVAVTVILSTVVGAFVFGLTGDVDDGSATAAQTDISVASADNQVVQLTNVAGSLQTTSLRLHISAGGDSADIYPNGTVRGSLGVAAGSGPFYNNSSWGAGETVTFRVTDSIPAESVEVAVVDGASGTLLSQKTAGLKQNFQSDCQAILNNGDSTGTGYYVIDPDGDGGTSPFEVYCDMETDGGGWTLVASYVDGSQLNAAGSDIGNGTLDWTARKDDRQKYLNPSVGSADTINSSDTVLMSYKTLSFDEQMFANDQNEWVKYQMTGTNVADWYATLEHGVDYENETENCQNESCTVNTNDIFPLAGANISTSVNECGSLKVRFLGEDSDTSVGHKYHGYRFGPSWQSNNNNACYWDDAGNSWTTTQLGGGNNENSQYIYWFVR